MGRVSKEKEAEIFHTYAESIQLGAEGVMNTAKFVTTEGLWVGLGIDFFLVTGEIHADSELLFAQREAMVAMFKTLDKIATTNIPILKDVNPFALINGFVRPLGGALAITIDEPEGPIKKRVPITARIPTDFRPLLGAAGFLLDEPLTLDVPVSGTKIVMAQPYYYPALPLPWRITIALMMPGIIRLVFTFLSSQLTGGSAFSKLL